MVQGNVTRRLVAILAADVVGYSRLMGEDEEGTLATLRAYREVIDELIAGALSHKPGWQGGATGIRLA